MNKQQNPIARGAKHANDPSKNDPTKQDERDNDATRIRPSKEKKEEPETPPGGGKAPGNVEEPIGGKPYEREPKHKPEPVEEPGKKQGNAINKGDHNPAAPSNRQDNSSEKDDEGNTVMKGFGKGL